MNPLVQRSWAPVGQTPVISPRTRGHQSVSTIGAIGLSPRRRRRLKLLMQLFPEQAVEQDHVLAFLDAMRRELRGNIVLVWDRHSVHRGGQVQKYLAKVPRIHQEFLPAYAPELNPVEYLWSWLKRADPLANHCPQTVEAIVEAVSDGVAPLPSNQALLRSFVRASKLPINFNLPARHYLCRTQ